jgi:hypothetical protein
METVSLDSPYHCCQFGTEFNKFSSILSKKMNIENEILKYLLFINSFKLQDELGLELCED